MSSVLQNPKQSRQLMYNFLTARPHQSPNREWLGKIVVSWLAGQSVLPDCLGLEHDQFVCFSNFFFPHFTLPSSAPSGRELDYSRMLEKEDLIKLLQTFSRDSNQESEWIISLMVSACLGSDHLWQDLGLWNRGDLSAMIAFNFPELAQRNNKDMKWKKFLYKQLCEAEGLFLCRAPTCEVCKDYSDCFGSEE